MQKQFAGVGSFLPKSNILYLLPIEIDEPKNERFRLDPECVKILKVYPGYYSKVGYHKPWIGYFATVDGKQIVGAGGFKGKLKEGKVELAYGTFKDHEGQGVGTEICRQLVLLALKTDPSLRVTARTIANDNASSRILQKNGFTCTDRVTDEDDGEVWEWELQHP